MKKIIIVFSTVVFLSGCSKDNYQNNKESSNTQNQTSDFSGDIVYLNDVPKKYPEAGKFALSGSEKSDVNDYKGAILDFKKSLNYITNEKDKAVVYFSIGFCYNKLFVPYTSLIKLLDLFRNIQKSKIGKKLLNNLKNF